MAQTDRLQGFNIGVAVKLACSVASTGNLTLSGSQTVDGVSVGGGERVLVKDQTTASENGIYISDSSTWARSKDFDGERDAKVGTFLFVDRGTTYGTSFWGVNLGTTSTAVSIGSDNITFSQITLTLAGVSSFSEGILTLGSSEAWKGSTALNIGTAGAANLGNSSTNLGLLDSTGLIYEGVQSWSYGGSIAAANTLDLGSTGNLFDITGNTQINAITGIGQGTWGFLRFSGTPTLAKSTSLQLNSSTDITIVAGDKALIHEYSSSAWDVTVFRVTAEALDLGFTTSGQILYFDGTNSRTLNLGSTGATLTSGATGPFWNTGSAGGWEEIGSVTAISTNSTYNDFASVFDDDTASYLIEVEDGRTVSGTANPRFHFYSSTGRVEAVEYREPGSASLKSTGVGLCSTEVVGATITQGVYSKITVERPGPANPFVTMHAVSGLRISGGDFTSFSIAGALATTSTAATEGFSISFPSGGQGNIRVYKR